MVGMPGSGKTYWTRQHIAAHPEKRYNILSTGALFERMQVRTHARAPHAHAHTTRSKVFW